MADNHGYQIDFLNEPENLSNYNSCAEKTNKRFMLLCAMIGSMTCAMLLAGWGVHLGLKEAGIIRSDSSDIQSILVGINTGYYNDNNYNNSGHPDNASEFELGHFTLLTDIEISRYMQEVNSQLAAIKSNNPAIYKQTHDDFMSQVKTIVNNWQPEIDSVSDQIMKLTLKSKLNNAENVSRQYQNDLYLQNEIRKSQQIMINIKNEPENWTDSDNIVKTKVINDSNIKQLANINHKISSQEKILKESEITLQKQLNDAKQKLHKLTTKRIQALYALQVQYLDKFNLNESRVMLTKSSFDELITD